VLVADRFLFIKPLSMDHEMSVYDPVESDVTILTKNDKIRRFFERQWNVLKKEVIELCTFHPGEWRNAFRRNPVYPILRKGDIDGLVALFIDNMATLLTAILSLQSVFDTDIIYGKIVPG
jgi:hypothetical protein